MLGGGLNIVAVVELTFDGVLDVARKVGGFGCIKRPARLVGILRLSRPLTYDFLSLFLDYWLGAGGLQVLLGGVGLTFSRKLFTHSFINLKLFLLYKLFHRTPSAPSPYLLSFKNQFDSYFFLLEGRAF